ncbi:MAG: glutamine amidotransferase [Pseudomonadota bacterium]
MRDDWDQPHGPASDTRDAAPIEKRPILIVLHQKHSVPGHIGRTLQLQGHPLDIRRPRFGDPLPKTMADYDGSVIFGGPMSANDPDDYVKAETDWIGVSLREQAPFLGVCLGGQMLARHLGAAVSLHDQGHVEIGYHDIIPLKSAADEGAWPNRFYQWHKEGFELPAGAELLATSPRDDFPNQAFRYGETAVAIQFHPEISYAMASRWSGYNPEKLRQVGAQARAEQLRNHIANGPIVRAWLDCFLSSWVETGRRARSLPSTQRRVAA